MKMHSLRAAFAALLILAAAAAAQEPERVKFPALKDFDGKPVALSALLYRPRGPGPFPALVMLHGCGGMFASSGNPTASYRYWADLFAQSGYVALLPDSFGPRGERSICDQQTRAILESRERVQDAYAARDWLASQPYVAADRIGLIGWSNGGGGTMYAMRASQSYRGFRAAVAFYPGCRVLSRTPYTPYAPVLILIGEADDWTLAEHCVALTKEAKTRGAPVDIVTYPGAYHAFDRINATVHVRPEVRNVNRPDRLGATVGENPEARLDSIKRTLDFFKQRLKD